VLARHANGDWPAIASAGNVYRHEYEAVDESLVWRTIQQGLKILRNAAEEELRRVRERGQQDP